MQNPVSNKTFCRPHKLFVKLNSNSYTVCFRGGQRFCFVSFVVVVVVVDHTG